MSKKTAVRLIQWSCFERIKLMRFRDLFFKDIDSGSKTKFQIHLLKDNIRRIRIFSYVVIIFESILAVSDLITLALRVDKRFEFNNYLIAYLVMIIVMILFLFYVNRIGDITRKPAKALNRIENKMMAYITFFLCWGSLISLMDQKLYGQLIVFMINMIVCSTLFYIECKKLLFPYILSSLILFIGLPFFQHSTDVLVGHYVNLVVFILISFICSRIIFYNYCHDFNNKILLDKMHLNLRQLSYLDELTNIPNRRSLNYYIESKYLNKSKSGAYISVIMIDIDFFKQFNDRYGHVEGDKVLVEVAEQISLSAADTDNFAARIGGEEFIYIVDNLSLEETMEIAEELRKSVMDLEIPHESSMNGFLTISLGISSVELVSENDVFKCIEDADKALYKAKESGRNCIRSYDAAHNNAVR